MRKQREGKWDFRLGKGKGEERGTEEMNMKGNEREKKG